MPISAFGQSVFNFVKSIHLLCKLVTRGSVFVFVNAAAFGAALWLFHLGPASADARGRLVFDSDRLSAVSRCALGAENAVGAGG